MPPWLPDRHGPTFDDARVLTDAEIATLAAWAAEDAPGGDLASAPAIPSFAGGWQLGTPDLVLRAESSWTMPAEGPDFYRNFVFRVPVTARRYVSALEIVPGNRRVTHHANVYVDHAGWARARDAEDPEPGFPGMDLQIASDRFDPESHFLFYKPGTPATREPADMAWPVQPGDDLVLNVHLRPSGKPEPLQPSLGLYFTDRAPSRHPMLLQLEDDRSLDIPPGATRFVVKDTLTLPVDVELVAVYPHAHYLGRIVEAWATMPDGTRVPIVRIADWDPAWQGVFRFASPPRLPKGTRIAMRWEYDNSAANPRNPNTPPARVRAGDQSTDEMAHVWVQVIASKREDQQVLQESVMRHRLARYPGDFSASANLAAVLQTRGRLDEAIALYRQAVRVRGDVASIRNALGTALLATGDADRAIAEFGEAVRLEPSSPDAHYNWGNALLALGRPADALPHFERAVAAAPGDGAILSDYATSLAMLGRFAEARPPFERALAIDASNAFAHYNLAKVLVQLGDLAGSVPHYEAAIRLDPGNTDAKEELAAVKGVVR
jgi:Flp pilus assembly protein TadD